MLRDISRVDEAGGGTDADDAAVSVKSGSSPLTSSRNRADGTKNKVPVATRLKSSSRS
jgi:hypothetical protein